MSYSDDLARLQKKRSLAQALIQQSAQPQGMQAGKFFVGPTPLSGLASLASIVAGGVMDRKYEKQEKDLQEGRRKQLGDILGRMGGISESGAVPSPAMDFIRELPVEQQEALVGQRAVAQLFPSAKEGFTLGPGQARYDASGKLITQGPVDAKSLFGSVSPSDFTPESLKLFQETGDYGVLKHKGGGQNIGNFNPGDYTPQSFARFMQSGNPNDLERYVTPANPSVQIVNGVPTVVQPSRSGGAPTQAPLSTLESETAAKGAIAGAEAGAKTSATAEAERAASAPQRAERVRQITTTIDGTVGEIDKALKGVDWSTTGLLGSINKAIPGTDAYDLAQTLLTVKANIGFDRLQQMRDASPTGGALGQVAVQELAALQASIASLDQAQSGSQLKTGLEKVKHHYNAWKQAVLTAQVTQKGGLSELKIFPNGSPEAAQADQASDPLGILGGQSSKDPLGILR